MKKQTKIAIGILIVLLVATVMLLKLNQPSVAQRQAFLKDEKFVVTAGETSFDVTMSNFENVVDISANYKPNGKKPVTRIYNGIPFSQLINDLEIDPNGYKTVVFTAIDGYTTAIDVKEAMDSQKCAIVISLDGQPLGGKENGGNGPYMMILPQDQFSQRWCKFLAKVEFQ